MGRLHRVLGEALHAHFDRQRAAYGQARADWRRDHPLIPGSTWTPESVGLPPRAEPQAA
jgi:hypothetical protein